MAVSRTNIGRQLELSAAGGSVLVTDVDGIPMYIAPGTEGQVLTTQSDLPVWADINFALLVDITLADLLTLIGSQTLVRGLKYKIERPNDTERLVVFATAIDSVTEEAFSSDFPQDIIRYSPYTDTILYREDTIKNLSAWWDWRTVKFICSFITFDFSGLSFPITPYLLTTSQGTTTYTSPPMAIDPPILNNMTDVDNYMRCVIAPGISLVGFSVAESMTFKYAGSPNSVEVMSFGTIDVQQLQFKDSFGVTQDIPFGFVTENQFYTFNNNFSTNFSHTPASDGNGGSCSNINIQKSSPKSVIGSNCYGIQITSGWIIFNNCYGIVELTQYSGITSNYSSTYTSSFITLTEQGVFHGYKGQSSNVNANNGMARIQSLSNNYFYYLGASADIGIALNKLYASVNLNTSTLLDAFDRITQFAYDSTLVISEDATIDRIRDCQNYKITVADGFTVTINLTGIASVVDNGDSGKIVGDVASITLVGTNKDYAIVSKAAIGITSYLILNSYSNLI